MNTITAVFLMCVVAPVSAHLLDQKDCQAVTRTAISMAQIHDSAPSEWAANKVALVKAVEEAKADPQMVVKDDEDVELMKHIMELIEKKIPNLSPEVFGMKIYSICLRYSNSKQI